MGTLWARHILPTLFSFAPNSPTSHTVTSIPQKTPPLHHRALPQKILQTPVAAPIFFWTSVGPSRTPKRCDGTPVGEAYFSHAFIHRHQKPQIPHRHRNTAKNTPTSSSSLAKKDVDAPVGPLIFSWNRVGQPLTSKKWCYPCLPCPVPLHVTIYVSAGPPYGPCPPFLPPSAPTTTRGRVGREGKNPLRLWNILRPHQLPPPRLRIEGRHQLPLWNLQRPLLIAAAAPAGPCPPCPPPSAPALAGGWGVTGK